ncbi:hypothetical protein HAP47_0022300 [Bradyrhizobium sp. 41S5]|uniref:hypothetical protein n=1 Tax=Bradyrhizobium sp. 41S5 TaxID=1404443 RepID=UPI00156AB7A9|nr:hypothetical protein [Bradyrhizobium sp. 41S5]UFX42021.1 hypothetical protein HAP47_0022300 [Bradyrhizobium sp. 41S5]
MVERLMPPERMTHSVLFTTGQIHALLMFAQSVVRSHPELLAEAEVAWQFGLAGLEQLPDAADVTIEGYQFVVGAIREAAASGQKK